MIRVAVLDDHPAVRAGLRGLLDSVDDLSAVIAANTSEALWRELGERRRTS